MKKQIFGIALIVLILGSLSFYKYLEYQHVKTINNFHNKFFSNHLRLMHQSFSITNQLSDTKEPADDSTAQEQKDYLDKSIALTRLALNNNRSIFDYLSESKKQVIGLESSNKFFPLTTKLFSSYFKGIIQYIDKYLEQNQNNDALIYSEINGSNIYRDMFDVDEFEAGYKGSYSTAKLAEYANDNFSKLSSIERYTRNDFKFEGEEIVKTHLPETHDALYKMRAFLSSYYEMFKDYAAGDIESAEYKYGKFRQNQIDLNLEFSKLDANTKEENQEIASNLIKIEKGLISAVNEIANNNPKYPFMSNTLNWNTDLLKCDYIVLSSEFYNNLTDEYPNSNNFVDLTNELRQKGIQVDKLDYSQEVFNLDNSPQHFAVKCHDAIANESYTYRHNKPSPSPSPTPTSKKK